MGGEEHEEGSKEFSNLLWLMKTRHLYRTEREMITGNIQIDNQQRLLVCIVCVFVCEGVYRISDMTVEMAEENKLHCGRR
jgi:hypothetical protein